MDKEYWKMKKREQRAARKVAGNTALILEKKEDVMDDATFETCLDPTAPRGMTPTDLVKERDRPGWYIFGQEVREKDCWRCGTKYTTRLEMSRFCTPKCKTAYLDSASHLREISQ